MVYLKFRKLIIIFTPLLPRLTCKKKEKKRKEEGKKMERIRCLFRV